jgi:hypothetical protein
MLRLPFPSIVVASSNDPYVTLSRAKTFATAWGSEFVMIGEAGHINSASGLGNWEKGLILLNILRKSATANNSRAADRKRRPKEKRNADTPRSHSRDAARYRNDGVLLCSE